MNTLETFMPQREPGIPNVDLNERKKAEARFEFKDTASAQEYLEWKHEVPFEFRRLVEARLKNSAPKLSQTGLALTDFFLTKFVEALQRGTSPEFSDAEGRVANLLTPLERIETRSGYLNVFETMASPHSSWKLKKTLYDSQIKPVLEWLVEQDLSEATQETQAETPQSQEQ